MLLWEVLVVGKGRVEGELSSIELLGCPIGRSSSWGWSCCSAMQET